MEHEISTLIGRYENGSLSRRELVATLAILAAAPAAASAAPAGFASAGLNHVSITVSNLNRSVEFYRRVFALPLIPTNGTNLVQLGVGKQHLSIRQGSPVGVDHFAIGVEGFNKFNVMGDLKARGASGEDAPGVGFHVKDPDGVQVQLIANA
jgi:catechol 2,3-dioxygenase-like lactoylglutathione lyase family enzyme